MTNKSRKCGRFRRVRRGGTNAPPTRAVTRSMSTGRTVKTSSIQKPKHVQFTQNDELSHDHSRIPAAKVKAALKNWKDVRIKWQEANLEKINTYFRENPLGKVNEILILSDPEWYHDSFHDVIKVSASRALRFPIFDKSEFDDFIKNEYYRARRQSTYYYFYHK